MILVQDNLICSKSPKYIKHIHNQFKQATLTQDALSWQEQDRQVSLSLNDVVGVAVVDDNSDLAAFVVSAYPLVKRKFQTSKRRLQEYYFICPSIESRSHWLKALYNALPLTANISPRRLQIFLNPYSGDKKAQHIFEQIKPLFQRSNLSWQLTTSTKPGEIKTLAQTIDISQIDSFVIVGGDGTVNELINGLMARSDWEIAITKPIGIIPTGTGNGLCKTLLDISEEPYDPISAAFMIAKGREHLIDLLLIQQQQQSYYSILSLSWALPSDVDVESAKLRYFGSFRNTIYTLWRTCFLHRYLGKLTFLPYSATSNSQEQTIEDEFILFWAMNTAWATYDLKIAPLAKFNDGIINVIIIRKGISKWELLSVFLSCLIRKKYDSPKVEHHQVKSFCLEPLTKSGILAVDGEKINYAPVQVSCYPFKLTVLASAE